MKEELSKTYNPKEVEERLYKFWEEGGFFHAEPNSSRKPYSIVIPPPNITGILHMGHALNNTLQDILIRYKRMEGAEALWMPGTDHAGIATQNVVERELAKEGGSREALGREKFVERMWQWQEDYGSTIIRQLKRLGSSCDWERERFTLDKGLSAAVGEVFILLYEKGLIYRGNYIINWCPRCQTALSDEEAPHRDMQGSLYYIKYRIKETVSEPRTPNPEPRYIVVATTRPETMLGDTAVAVNPNDERYKELIGKTLILPLAEREIKVIADTFVDPEFGTGAVKVTPAHDPNDFEIGKRHKLPSLLIMNPDGTMNANAGDFKGMDRFEAREAVIESLKERKLIVKIEPHSHTVGHCYRCNTVVEPYLSRQWFVKMKPLAAPAIEAVKSGRIKFYPSRWTKVYLNWMENIRDWCISRQIWWGHRIPVWYCKKCQEDRLSVIGSRLSEKQPTPEPRPPTPESGVVVSRSKLEKCPSCHSADIYQDPDVLDTWFSSWLWPFSTFGWPFDGKELKYFYPTSVLITAPEIIFFWVARMIMAGLEFTKEIPFKDVYIHGTVRDDTGTKMSKSLGNTIDPLEVIEEFGTDALRFSIISITAQGQDVFLSKEKFHLGRNFANKLWNASRFILMNLKEDMEADLCQVYAKAELELADRWILSRFYSTVESVGTALDNYRFNDAANALYHFIWHQFCDWYIEIAKLRIDRKQTQILLYKILEKSLRLLHPFMPFITEEIWQNLRRKSGRIEHRGSTIMRQPLPHIQKQIIDKDAEQKMELLIELIAAIRNIRAELNIPNSAKLNLFVSSANETLRNLIEENAAYIKHLAKVESLEAGQKIARPLHSASAVVGDAEIFIPLEGVLDLEKERGKLLNKQQECEAELKRTQARLQNKNFTQKAPAEVVAKEREKAQELARKLEKLGRNIEQM